MPNIAYVEDKKRVFFNIKGCKLPPAQMRLHINVRTESEFGDLNICETYELEFSIEVER